ncbi:ubiquitin carboxyl-terminal hydrolase 29-like [Asterias rubens]|uniref:ubiquitin carboxyl-terminal hydrolase 29-like n=1 Tax=Asterias rubens TaxID=7604 RepID=UPI001454F1F4|nr:ubiquitin carboxyl-terminal hydrolase 29-like [Asterias rubens]
MPRRSRSNPIGSIQTALEQFFREEGIEYARGECNCKQAIVTHKFTKLPRVIIIHLKRYKFDVWRLPVLQAPSPHPHTQVLVRPLPLHQGNPESNLSPKVISQRDVISKATTTQCRENSKVVPHSPVDEGI